MSACTANPKERCNGYSNRQRNPRAEPQEWDQRVNEQARKRLGMSSEEFERRLNAGEIDIDDSPDMTRVAMMLPLHATLK
jgi:hypothetical protein